MTKEITKAFILQEMQDKLKLRELIPEKFSFSEMVVPTYNIEQHIKFQTAEFVERSITSASPVVFFTVPPTERWTFDKYDVVFMGAGAYTVSGVYVDRLNKQGTATTYLDLTAGQSASYHVNLPVPVMLGSGDKLWINVDGYTSVQGLRLYLDYTKEEIR